MIAFLDFEASSLSKDSYPIEVAWIFEDGRSAAFLIRPADDWADWSSASEQIHGLSISMLETQGYAVEAVANEMVNALAGHDLYASAPSWDGKWLSVLLRRAGYPRNALRLKDSEEAFALAARQALGSSAEDAFVANIVSESMRAKELGIAEH